MFDNTKGYLAYLFSYYYLSGYYGDPIEYHQTTYSPWFDTGPVTDRDTYYSMIGKYPNCPLCAVAYYNDLSSDYPQSQSPIWDPILWNTINDNAYEWQTRTYKDKLHSKYEFYFWHPFIEVTCDLSTNANVDYPGYYDDEIHYPGCKMPKCPVLSVYMDMSADTVYPSLPTPVWPTH